MGQPSSKAYVEQIIREVKDMEAYIRRNGRDLNEESRNNLHRRLIDCSSQLQSFSKVDRRHARELKEAIRYVSKVIGELFKISNKDKDKNLDMASVETESFVHYPTREDQKSLLKENNKRPENRRSLRARKEIKSYPADKVPSIKEIENKTISLKSEIDTSIQNDDINQLHVQQKTIQILATDLEILQFDQNGTLQRKKVALEKELNVLYRRIEKAKLSIKKRSGDSSSLKDEKTSSLKRKEAKVNRLSAPNPKLLEINAKIDKIKTKAQKCAKEDNAGELRNLKHILSDLKDELERSKEESKIKSEVGQNISYAMIYIGSEFERIEHNKKIEAILGDIAKTEALADECAGDINDFDESTFNEKYDSYKRHLTDLEHFLNSVEASNEHIKQQKYKCMKKIKDTLEILEDKLNKVSKSHKNKTRESTDGICKNENNYKESRVSIILSSHKDTKEKTPEKEISPHSNENKKTESETSEDEVVLRRNLKPPVNKNEIRNIDGLYTYWKELENNLPATNCSLNELQQIALLLNEIETQIYSKRIKILKFLDLKHNNQSLQSFESIDEKTPGSPQSPNQSADETKNAAIKTNAKIYNLRQPKVLVINDEDILKNITEINQQAAKVVPLEKHTEEKQVVEKVILTDQSSNQSDIDSSANKTKVASEDNASKAQKYVEYITQIQNINRDVEYLKEKISSQGSKNAEKNKDIIRKLNSYRTTLEPLISHSNENITEYCKRVLENIDETYDMLNKTGEENELTESKIPIKRATIEKIFTDIVNKQTMVDDLNLRIEHFKGCTHDEEYNLIRDSLIQIKEYLRAITVSKSYVAISSTKSDTLKKIDIALYDLEIKLQENKSRAAFHVSTDPTVQVYRNKFIAITEKINRFRGSYKNILYRGIEKEMHQCLQEARLKIKDEMALRKFEEEAAKYFKILESKSTKDHTSLDEANKELEIINNNSKSGNEDLAVEIAIRLSAIRQNLLEINNIQQHDRPSHKLYQELDNKINYNLLELKSIDISQNQPFYSDKQSLMNDFTKISHIIKTSLSKMQHVEDVRSEKVPELHLSKGMSEDEKEILKIENDVARIKTEVDIFADGRNSKKFLELDDMLSRMLMGLDNIHIQEDGTVKKKKHAIEKEISKCREILETKAQRMDVLLSIEQRVKNIVDSLNANLSDGQRSRYYNELIDLEETLEKSLADDARLVKKKNACKFNIRYGMKVIEQTCTTTDDDEDTFISGSTLV